MFLTTSSRGSTLRDKMFQRAVSGRSVLTKSVYPVLFAWSLCASEKLFGNEGPGAHNYFY